MEDIVPGYMDAKVSLLAKLEEPIEMFLLVKLKLAQIRAGGQRIPAIEQELKENLMIHAREIDEKLLQEIENETNE